MKTRVSTGVDGLDDLIEGGFPKGSLILLAGSPGSGKTIASAQYLYHGATEFGEKGVYISFGEKKHVFCENMKRFGLDFKQLEADGKFKFLDMVTPVDEEFSVDSLNIAMREVQSMKTRRLVIDSFSAMVLAFNKKADARIILNLLEDVMREIGCTTLLIVEVPTGDSRLGLGFEEFVADGIILFQIFDTRSGIRKRAVLRKMRGTNHNQNYSDIVISDEGLSLRPYVT
ncbi:MAG: AAA family ATPase [Candidatus Bathyarchaeota archaeon]|nr:MAG: AAA family ATPase [Candidatus Bathyarchaeota archaeon]